VGGTAVPAGNIIAFNNSGGVGLGGTGNSIRHNSIFGNTSRGISSGAKAPTLSITSGQVRAALTAATPNTQFTIEFFSNPSCGAAGVEQGKTFIGEATVTTDGSGNGTVNGPAGSNLTATASATGINTSPFSPCIAGVAPPGQINLDPTQLTFITDVGTNPVSKQVTLKNTGGSTMNWQAATATTSGGNWMSVNPTSGALAENQSTTLTVAVTSNNLLSDVYTGTISVTSADASNSPQKVNVSLTLSCPLSSASSKKGLFPAAPSCTDILSIDLFSTVPQAGASVSEYELKTNGFKAKVSYLLQSVKNADMKLIVFDGQDLFIAQSTIQPVTRPDPAPNPVPSVDFVIPGSEVKLFDSSKTLRMYALFINPANGVIIKKSAEIPYVIVRDSIQILDPTVQINDAAPGSFAMTGDVRFQCQVEYLGDPRGPKGSIGLIGSVTRGAILTPVKLATMKSSKSFLKTTQPERAFLSFEFEIPNEILSKYFPAIIIEAVLIDSSGNLLATDRREFNVPDWLVLDTLEINNDEVWKDGSVGSRPPLPDDGNITLKIDFRYRYSSGKPGLDVVVLVLEGALTPRSETVGSKQQPVLMTCNNCAVQGSMTLSFKVSDRALIGLRVAVGFPNNEAQNILINLGPRPSGDYQLQGNRNSIANPGNISQLAGTSPVDSLFSFSSNASAGTQTVPGLTDLIAPSSSTGNSFANDIVDGASYTVLKFPNNNGLKLSPTTGVIPNNVYTVVMLCKFDEANKLRRLVDFKNGSSDNGLYASADNRLRFNPSGTGTNNLVGAGSYVQVALSRESNGATTGYVNGIQQLQFTDTNNDAVIDSNNSLRFFQDNLSGGNTGEASGGSIARLRLYGRALSATEIAALDREPSNVQFSASSYTVSEGAGFATITVARTGATTLPATVDYITSDDTARQKSDYTFASRTLSFAPGETSKTFQVLVTDNSFVDLDRDVTLFLINPNGVALAAQSFAVLTITDNETAPSTTNPVDQSRFFVQQHYYDFLSRYPDPSGWDFWTNNINNCAPQPSCIEFQRINTSAAYFLSIEFQQTGYLIERLNKAAYGDGTGTSTFPSMHQLPVPVVRYAEFLSDTQQIGQGVVVGQPGWEQVLENNKQSFAAHFVQRSSFIAAFPTTMTPVQFVDKLNQNAGNVLSSAQRTTVISLFAGATDSSNTTARAQALRQVAEDQDLYNAEFNRAFVLMQFFGYLRRDPNSAPDADHTGFDFWLTKLNQFNGDYIRAEMVKAFITSSEYRQRFGP
jgi:hypothetical protein